jgi:hypothetical protein
MADAEFVYGMVADKNKDGNITESEMAAAWTYALGECVKVHQIHFAMASKNGCLAEGSLAEDGMNMYQFTECLDQIFAEAAAAAIAAASNAAAAAAE